VDRDVKLVDAWSQRYSRIGTVNRAVPFEFLSRFQAIDMRIVAGNQSPVFAMPGNTENKVALRLMTSIVDDDLTVFA